jgi:hypothetical protein
MYNFSCVCGFLSSCSTINESVTVPNDVKTSCLNGIEHYLFKKEIGYKGYGFMSVKYLINSHIML